MTIASKSIMKQLLPILLAITIAFSSISTPFASASPQGPIPPLSPTVTDPPYPGLGEITQLIRIMSPCAADCLNRIPTVVENMQNSATPPICDSPSLKYLQTCAIQCGDLLLIPSVVRYCKNFPTVNLGMTAPTSTVGVVGAAATAGSAALKGGNDRVASEASVARVGLWSVVLAGAVLGVFVL
ncbi:hypothetical protein HDU97_000946 [Phlyctochytrium planicorne]|nr:hypothetical protein HDU97_000946 [Phlyctochytrium planicorne]